MGRVAAFHGWDEDRSLGAGSEVTRVTPTSKQTTSSRAKNRLLRLKVKSKDVTERCC